MRGARCSQSPQRFGQSCVSPIQNVVVCKGASRYSRGAEATDVLGMHAIMNSLPWPGSLLRCDRGLQVYDSKVDLGPLQFLQRMAPDVIEGHRPRYRAVRFLGKIYIFLRVAHVWLVQNRAHRMRQRLIAAAPAHHVAAE